MATAVFRRRMTFFRFPSLPDHWFDRVSRFFLFRPLVCLLIAVMTGGYIAFYASGLYRTGIAAVSYIVLFSLMALKSGHLREEISIGLAMLGFCAAYVSFSYFRQKLELRSVNDYYEGEAVVVSANSTDEGYKNIVLKLRSGEKVIWLTEEQFDYGASLKISGTLEVIHSRGNPGDLDLRAYYRNMGIVRALDRPSFHTVANQSFSPIVLGYRIGDSISRVFYKTWSEVTDEETAMILAAMVVGDDSHLTAVMKEDFRDSNLSHLLVVSGAHVGYFTGTISMFISVFIMDRRRKTTILTIALVFFGFVSGWSGPAARSIFSYILLSLLTDGNHSVDRISVCASSALVIFMFDPYSIFSSGMLLSFGATFSILMFRERVENILKTYIRALPIELNRAISCFLCAQLGMIPVLLSMGNAISVLGLVVVIFAGFPAETICCLCLPLTLLCQVVPCVTIEKCLFAPVRGLSSVLTLLAKIGSDKTWGRFSLRFLPGGVVFSLICFAVSMLIRSGFRRNVILAAGFLGMILSLVQIGFIHDHTSKVYFLDVGQGDCALILHNGIAVLVDGGRKGSGTKIEKVMEYFGIETIDIAFATHLDIDHIGGILELYENGKIENVYTSFWSESSEMDQLQTEWPKLPTDVGLVSAGDCVMIDEDLRFDVLWPTDPENGGNDDSLVLYMKLYDARILFTGDISEETEMRITDVVPNDINVLKVAHHGSKYSTSYTFLENKKIDAAVISVGYNLYGHPSREVLSRLEESAIPYFRTDEAGCVLLSVSEESWEMDYYFA